MANIRDDTPPHPASGTAPQGGANIRDDQALNRGSRGDSGNDNPIWRRSPAPSRRANTSSSGHAAIGDQGTSLWLFPGGHPGRPISAFQLGERLRQLGLHPDQARSTALFQLATDLPAALLARMLGIHITVAVAWQRASSGDWTSYAAEVSRRLPGTGRSMSPPAAPHPGGVPPHSRAIVLITGIQAAGKSTVAQLLAERLPRSVHIRGDLFRRMVINGRADMTPNPTDEALRQLQLRYQLTATVSDAYFDAGFTVITQDVVLGEHLAQMIGMIRSRPLLLVVLAPHTETIAAREKARGKLGYDSWTIDQLDDVLRHQTPRLGLWLDTSEQTPTETVDEILSRAWTEATMPEQLT